MTASSPTDLSSPLAGAQFLRRRHSRLSPLRLGVYGLVSLGSHLLLLGLFRWAWQVQLATQPVGSPIGIDFVEVDLSDGSFADQLPTTSDDVASGSKLSATQLNELIAQGSLSDSDAVSETNGAALGEQTGVGEQETEDLTGANPTAELPVADQNGTIASSSPDPETEQPRSWFPFGQPKQEGEGLFGDRPLFPAIPTAPSEPANETESPIKAGEASNSDSQDESPTITPPQEDIEATSDSELEATEAEASPSNPATTEATESESPVSPAPEPSANDVEEAEVAEPTGETTNTTGRPNELPPNMSEQPVASNQEPGPDEQPVAEQSPAEQSPAPEPANGNETSSGTNSNSSETTPPSEAASGGGSTSGSDGAGASEGGSSAGASSDDTAAGDEGAGSEAANSAPANSEPTAGTATVGEAEESNTVTRLRANLEIDEGQSFALNTQDVVTQLPRPLGDPLSQGSQAVGSGQCAEQLARLTPASYGQSVPLNLAVDPMGEVFYVEAADAAQSQTPIVQAITCVVRYWPFEPAQRVLDEGGEQKIENAGASLFVRVTISLLEE